MYKMYTGSAPSKSLSIELYRQGSSYNLLEGSSIKSEEADANYELQANLEKEMKKAVGTSKADKENTVDDNDIIKSHNSLESRSDSVSSAEKQQDPDAMFLILSQSGDNPHDLNSRNPSFHKISQYFGNDNEDMNKAYTPGNSIYSKQKAPQKTQDAENDISNIRQTREISQEDAKNMEIHHGETPITGNDDIYSQQTTPSYTDNKENRLSVIMENQDGNECDDIGVNDNETENKEDSQSEAELESESNNYLPQNDWANSNNGNNFMLEQYSDSDEEEIGRANIPTPSDLHILDIMRPLDDLTDLHEKKYAVLPSIGNSGSKLVQYDEDNPMYLNQLDYTRDHIEEEADFFSEYRINTSVVKMTPRNNPLPPIKHGNKKISRESELH